MMMIWMEVEREMKQKKAKKQHDVDEGNDDDGDDNHAEDNVNSTTLQYFAAATNDIGKESEGKTGLSYPSEANSS